MNIACAFDHAGVPLRETVITALQSAGHDPQDLGTLVQEQARGGAADAAVGTRDDGDGHTGMVSPRD